MGGKRNMSIYSVLSRSPSIWSFAHLQPQLSPPPPSSLAPIQSRMETFWYWFTGCLGKWPLKRASILTFVDSLCRLVPECQTILNFVAARNDGCDGESSSYHYQPTNTQVFYRTDALSVIQPTVSEHWRQNYINKKMKLTQRKIKWLLPDFMLKKLVSALIKVQTFDNS